MPIIPRCTHDRNGPKKARAIIAGGAVCVKYSARPCVYPLFVGTPTAGANGDVTSILLPGGLEVRFTGHDVRFPDGRQLQRTGIQPDVRVAPTLRGIRAGRDEVLEAGLRLARVGGGGR